jgi:FAD-dependent urate hydroxylase
LPRPPVPIIEVAIVGAGPYGLSTAAHLRCHGLPFRIFGSPMESWRRSMPAGMYLKSEGRASNLSDPTGEYTLATHCRSRGLPYDDDRVPVPLATFCDYGLSFQQRLVPDVEDTRVVRLDHTPAGYLLETATGETLAAGVVVLAVGSSHFAHVPEQLAHLPRTLLSHTSERHDLTLFAGRHLTVIGGGQSALETAALAREQGADVRVFVRRPALAWNATPPAEPRPLAQRLRYPTTGLGAGWRLRYYAEAPTAFHRLPERLRVHAVRTSLGPAGSWWLRERVLGRLPVHTGHRVVRAEAHGSGVRLRLQRDDGRVIDCLTEHVVAGTGYRVDLDRLPFLSDRLRARIRLAAGAPVLSSSLEASVANLHILGLASAYSLGPSMRFVYGADWSARRLAGHLLGRSSRREARPVMHMRPRSF